MKAFSLKGIGHLLKDSFSGFSEDKVPKLGGALAYFTIFSIGPMLLVIIFLVGIILGKQAVEGSLYQQIQQLVGSDAARQIQQIIKSAAISKGGTIAFVIGLATLLIGATSIFTEIQDSINGIWQLKARPRQSWWHMLISRLLSFGIVASIGFLLLVSLAASAFIEGLGKKLQDLVPGFGFMLFYLLSQALTLLTASFLFAMIFKLLPASQLRWRQAWPGALVTALLFMFGRFAISFYISKGNFGSAYGAAGSLVIVLVWVYYSSLILYFGAEFTKAYCNRFGNGIPPNAYAVSTKESSLEKTNSDGKK
jgi:membrane protein